LCHEPILRFMRRTDMQIFHRMVCS
jgi:hypothetical protein